MAANITSAVVNVSTAATSALVAAPGTGYFVRVYGYVFLASGTTTVTLKNGTTALHGGYDLTAQCGISAFAAAGWFDCSENAALNLTNSAAVQVSGHVRYAILPVG